jgi:hypothetical protein
VSSPDQPCQVYRRWVRAGSSSGAFAAISLGGFVLPELLSAGSQVWLGRWSEHPGQTGFYMGVYAALSLTAMLLVLGRAFAWASIIVSAAEVCRGV